MIRIFIFLAFLISSSQCFGQQPNKYEVADKSIFKIIAYDFSDNSIHQGSGVFISNNGIGISNYHVLENVDSAYIVTKNGNVHGIVRIIDYSSIHDLVKFKVNINTSVPANISQSVVSRGEDVFALGYPCGLDISGGSTLSKGIVSAVRNINEVDYIQSSAQITHGSSGGGLFDNSGRLIGITQGTFASNLEDVHANLYKIIPIKYVNLLIQKINKTLSDFKAYNINSQLAKFDFNVEIGNYDEAETLILKMLERNIIDPRLWNKYGNILGKYKLNKKDLAFKCYQNAIALNPFYIRYKSNYALCLSEYSLNEDALKLLKIESDNNSKLDAHYYYALGYCLASNKQFYSAISNLENASKLYNKDGNIDNFDLLKRIWYELAYCFQKVKKHEESIEVCNNLVFWFPDYFPPYLLRAQSYYHVGKSKEACNDLNNVINNAPPYYRERAISEKEYICR